MSLSVNRNSSVPPGFRFHPTDEELLYYYLKKKVSYEKIDLDVIRDVDLNKLEPWDLHERCKIGSAPQNEWYFFSHKDKKYPTGSRTNRATAAGFWKATGRDKAIRNGYKRIGMRKTLVFYRGRAPHGHKTDWIMHEYRLDDNDNSLHIQEDDGWVVCRVFKKKNQIKPGREESRQTGSYNMVEENTCLVSEPKECVDSLSEIQQISLCKQDLGGMQYANLNLESHHHHHEQQQQIMQMQMAQQQQQQQMNLDVYNSSCNPSSSSVCSPNTKRFFPERVIENMAKCINYQLPNNNNNNNGNNNPLDMVSSTSSATQGIQLNEMRDQLNDWSTLEGFVASHLNNQDNSSKQEVRYGMAITENHHQQQQQQQIALPHRGEIDLWNFGK